MKIHSLVSLALFVIFSFLFSNVHSQAPESFNYQAIIRDAVGDPIEDQVVSLRISIIATTPGGTTVYTEEHADTTNAFGLVTVSVGTGTTSDDFSAIDWSSDNYFLKIEVDPTGGSSYEWYGTTQLLSVPYALYAKESGSLAGNWTQSGDDIYYITGNVGIGTDNPYGVLEVQATDLPANDSILFEVKNNDGQVVFGVYPEGVRVYVDDLGGKGTRGGFAVGGFSSGKGPLNEYLRVTPDSVRVYVSEDVKGTRGGFAVGGFSSGKGLTNQYLRVTPDSTNVLTRGPSGSFAINNLDGGDEIRYTYLTPVNTFIGFQTGINNTSGADNIFLGTQAGYSNDTSYSNIFIGNASGASFGNGSSNVCLGNRTGTDLIHGVSNTIIGHESGARLDSGQLNTFIGAYAGHETYEGEFNVCVGAHAGEDNYFGVRNILIGSHAGQGSSSSHSILIGSDAGLNNSADWNTFIGNWAGVNHKVGENNIFIGNSAGIEADTCGFSILLGCGAGSNNRGDFNTFIGNNAGNSHKSGGNNTYIGAGAGFMDTTGRHNIFIGFNTGFNNSSHSNIFIGNDAGGNNNVSNNIMIGRNAGVNNNGWRNIFIGRDAGANETGSAKLIIESYGGDSTEVLIWGDMWNNLLRFNGMVGIDTTPGMALDVKGNARFSEVGSGTYASDLNLTADGTLTTASSDSRLKENIVPLQNSLNKVLELEVYSFTWKEDASGKNDIGLIAQEVKDIYPELVFQNKTDGYYGINYSRLPAILIAATKEQQAHIEQLNAEISELHQRIKKLEELLLEKE